MLMENVSNAVKTKILKENAKYARKCKKKNRENEEKCKKTDFHLLFILCNKSIDTRNNDND